MGGERLRIEGYPELSGICTHPAHRGKGLASDVIGHLVRCHRRDGLRSWLHVGVPNTRAIDLYKSLGFKRVRILMLHRIVRPIKIGYAAGHRFRLRDDTRLWSACGSSLAAQLVQ